MPVPSSVSRAVSRLSALPKAARAGLIVVVVLLAAVVASARLPGRNGAAGPSDQTATVEKRDFVRRLRLNGVLEASRSVFVTAPRLSGPGGSQLIITKLVPAGSSVKAGDLIVELDRQTQLRNYLEREAEYLGLLEELKKKRADQQSASDQDDAELQKSERDVDRARLDVRKSEVLSRIDGEKNARALEEAEARFAQLGLRRALRKKSAAADLRAMQIRAERAQRAMSHARRNMEKLQIRAAIDGIVVLPPVWRNTGPSEVQEGDEVRSGQTFLQIVDPETMQVRTKVNQADLHLLQVGQKAEVRLDAYPDVVLPGRIEQLGAVGSTTFSDRVRTFMAIVSIGRKEARMMPDLSAAIDVELERVPGALVLPRDAVRAKDKDTGRVQLASGGHRDVKLGSRSDHEIVILSGLEEQAAVRRAGGRE